MNNDFDFDAWVDLARNDPREFERRRLSVIDETCERMGPRRNRRLIDATRWRIDMERARAKTPLQCCLRLSSLMWDSVHELTQMCEWPRRTKRKKADVLELKPRGEA